MKKPILTTGLDDLNSRRVQVRSNGVSRWVMPDNEQSPEHKRITSVEFCDFEWGGVNRFNFNYDGLERLKALGLIQSGRVRIVSINPNGSENRYDVACAGGADFRFAKEGSMVYDGTMNWLGRIVSSLDKQVFIELNLKGFEVLVSNAEDLFEFDGNKQEYTRRQLDFSGYEKLWLVYEGLDETGLIFYEVMCQVEAGDGVFCSVIDEDFMITYEDLVAQFSPFVLLGNDEQVVDISNSRSIAKAAVASVKIPNN